MNFLKDIAHNIRVHGHAVWLCARDPDIGWTVRLLAFAIAGYALSPIDLIPDFIPVIGLLDDAILIPLGIWILRQLIPAAIYDRNRVLAETAAQHPISMPAAMCILSIWAAVAAYIGYMLFT
jgi:uncharacterized membrane protein YkvA (DUF1232 family)